MAHALAADELGRLRAGVGDAVRTACDDLVMPRFRNLAKDDVSEKAPGAVVTEVDRAVEERLGRALRRLLPGSLVVGEEAVAGDPSLLGRLADGFVWLVDPLDGTGNYVAGVGRFATMVTLLHEGEPILGHIHEPARERSSWSTRGCGRGAPRKGRTPPVGAAWTRYFAEPLRRQVEERLEVLPQVGPGQKCVGSEYQDLLWGRQDFVLFWRSMPWDHAAGVLMVRESGGYAAYLDDTPYAVGARRYGLLVACDEPTWRAARALLVGGVDDPANLLGREHPDY